MPTPFSVDEFEGKVDSLYRLVIVAARRANQISKNESHGFGTVIQSKKSTITALEEVLDDKLGYYTGTPEEENYLE
ncbi:MAG: DNA-directed RNA polymerase subunit omega [Candidatus Hydrogenedentes bacterium]|nr:DNA-directed RNA polymerase subunit omega [Candidatus Hydrogenedentota bacterium]